MSNTTTIALFQSLDEGPITRMHWKIWFLSAMGIFLDGFDLFIIGVALPLITAEMNADPWTVGLIGAAAPLGAMIGAFTLGPLTDRLGRKSMYLVDLFLFIVFTALSALAWDPLSLMTFRFLLGVGIGADYPISSSYIVEFMPARLRGKMLIGGFSFQAVGALTGALVGLIILLAYPQLTAWRWMLAAGLVPALAILAMRTQVPESPRWYQSHGRLREALVVAAEVTGRDFQMTDSVMILREKELAEPRPSPRGRLAELLSSGMRRRILLSCLPWFLMDVALYGVGIFTPTILASVFSPLAGAIRKHPHSAASNLVFNDVMATEGAMALDLFLVVGFLLCIALVERVGRIPLQLYGFAGMALGLALLAAGAALPGGPDRHLGLIFVGFGMFNLMVNLGPNATTYLLPAELYPTRLRATGHGLAAGCGKVGAVVGIFLLPTLMEKLGLGLTMTLMAGACSLGAVVTRACQLETSGRPLEETAR